MLKQKIFYIFLFTLFLMCSFTFIFAGGKGEKAEPKAELHWYFYNGIPYAEDWYRQILDQYMDEHPGQDYEMSSVMWDEILGKISAAAAGEAEIDIMFIDASNIYDLVDMDVLLDLTDLYGDYSHFRLDSQIMLCVVNNRLMVVPLNGMDVAGVYYNKEIFNKYGLKVPKTYDDLVKISKTLRKNGIGPMVTVGTALYLGQPWNHILGQFLPNSMQWALDVRYGKARFDIPEVLESFRMMQRMVDDGVWVDNLAGIDENTSYSVFVRGTVAMHYNGTWIAPALVDTAGGADKFPDIGVFPLPYFTPEQRDTASGGFFLYAGIYKDIKKEKMQSAVEILRFMTTAEACKTLTELDMSPFASRKDVTPEMEPLTKEFVPIAKFDINDVTLLLPEEIRLKCRSNIQAMVAGMMTPEEAVRNTQEVVEQYQKQIK